MKKALIDSSNNRVVQVADEEFEVHGALYWVDCPEGTDGFYQYDPEGKTFTDPHAHNKDVFGNPVEPFTMQRMRAYPPTSDQLDMLWKELRDTGTISKDGNWYQAIHAVKQSVAKPIDPSVNVQILHNDGTLASFYSEVPASRTNGTGRNGQVTFRKTTDQLQVAVETPGLGYAVDNTITIPGSDVEEEVDITLRVIQTDPAGGLVRVEIV